MWHNFIREFVTVTSNGIKSWAILNDGKLAAVSVSAVRVFSSGPGGRSKKSVGKERGNCEGPI